MNKEIKYFKNELFKYNADFGELGYRLKTEKIFNVEKVEYVYYEVSYLNKKNGKLITFNFYPSTSKFCNNQVIIYFTFNSISFGLSEYLAYQKLQRRINVIDVEPYRFTCDVYNLRNSISHCLNRVFDLFYNELKEFLTTEMWIQVPISDPRDDY